jgi:hypothetical protein
LWKILENFDVTCEISADWFRLILVTATNSENSEDWSVVLHFHQLHIDPDRPYPSLPAFYVELGNGWTIYFYTETFGYVRHDNSNGKIEFFFVNESQYDSPFDWYSPEQAMFHYHDRP